MKSPLAAFIVGLCLAAAFAQAVTVPTFIGRTVIIGSGTTAQRPAASSTYLGALYVNTDDTTCDVAGVGSLEYSNGATWRPICATDGGVASGPQFWRDAGSSDITPDSTTPLTSVIIPSSQFSDGGIEVANTPLMVFSARDGTTAPHGAATFASGGFTESDALSTSGLIQVRTKATAGQIASIVFSDTASAVAGGGLYANSNPAGGGANFYNYLGYPTLVLGGAGIAVGLNSANSSVDTSNVIALPDGQTHFPRAGTGNNAIVVNQLGGRLVLGNLGSGASYLAGDGDNIYSPGGVFDSISRIHSTVYLNTDLVSGETYGGTIIDANTPNTLFTRIVGFVRTAGSGGSTDVSFDISNGVDTCSCTFACNIGTGPFAAACGSAGDCQFNANETLTFKVNSIGDCTIGPDIQGTLNIEATNNPFGTSYP